MRELRVILCFLGVFATGVVRGYQCFCCIQHLYSDESEYYPKIKNQDKITYSYTINGKKYYVKLSRLDRHLVINRLAKFAHNTSVTHDLMQSFLTSSSRRDRVVGFVLRDFLKRDGVKTIADVLTEVEG